ncbi:MAG: thiamine-phosphate kinase [Dehalococcoidia bacterium]|nr:thiamine-phosphate kinase [Dehalococcoidia bacterium]
MRVSKIGEFGLIYRLAGLISKANRKTWQSSRQVIVGLGDDAAVWRPQNPYQIATVDSLVENIHFTLRTITWEELGWKSIAVNLSDIAAMGGTPRYALISIGLPENTEVENVEALYRGMIKIAGQHRVNIIGGDTVSSPFLFISVTVLGTASNAAGRVLTRSAANPGDRVAVTNSLGASAAGLQMLLHGLKFESKLADAIRKAHVTPTPRIKEGQTLVAKAVKCGIDISDGLVGDLTHICEMSKVGARLNVDAVPVSPAAKVCFPEKALELALTGGEDYELLFTAPTRVMPVVRKALACPVTVVGEITADHPGKVVLVDGAGKPYTMKKSGWDHFGQ